MTPTAIAAESTGTGSPVVVLHPAGFGPDVVAPLAERLATDLRVIVPARRGYAGSAALAPTASVDEATDDLVAVLDDLDIDRATVVGVSAGATLTLAFADRHPDRVAAALSHEPLIGPAATQLHDIVTTRIAALLDEPDERLESSVAAFMSELVGIDTWNHLRPTWRDEVRRNATTTRREVAMFPPFALDRPALERLAEAGVVTSIGRRSGEARHEVAAVLADAGVAVRTIDDAGHLPLVEAPDAFAALIREIAPVGVGS